MTAELDYLKPRVKQFFLNHGATYEEKLWWFFTALIGSDVYTDFARNERVDFIIFYQQLKQFLQMLEEEFKVLDAFQNSTFLKLNRL